jgi:hypothetical protein
VVEADINDELVRRSGSLALYFVPAVLVSVYLFSPEMG